MNLAFIISVSCYASQQYVLVIDNTSLRDSFAADMGIFTEAVTEYYF